MPFSTESTYRNPVPKADTSRTPGSTSSATSGIRQVDQEKINAMQNELYDKFMDSLALNTDENNKQLVDSTIERIHADNEKIKTTEMDENLKQELMESSAKCVDKLTEIVNDPVKLASFINKIQNILGKDTSVISSSPVDVPPANTESFADKLPTEQTTSVSAGPSVFDKTDDRFNFGSRKTGGAQPEKPHEKRPITVQDRANIINNYYKNLRQIAKTNAVNAELAKPQNKQLKKWKKSTPEMKK